MEQMGNRIIEAQAAVNRCRNEITTPGVGGYRKMAGHYQPGNTKYRPPTKEFVTMEFKNGFVTMPVEDFNKLPKSKKNRLMKR